MVRVTLQPQRPDREVTASPGPSSLCPMEPPRAMCSQSGSTSWEHRPAKALQSCLQGSMGVDRFCSAVSFLFRFYLLVRDPAGQHLPFPGSASENTQDELK